MVLSIVFLGLLVCVARELLSFSKFNSCFQNEVLTKQKSQLQTKLLIRYFQNQTTYQLNLGSNQNHIIRLFWLVCLGSGYYYPVAKWGPIWFFSYFKCEHFWPFGNNIDVAISLFIGTAKKATPSVSCFWGSRWMSK